MSQRPVAGCHATAHGRLFDAVIDDGPKLDEQALIERVGWALALIDEMANQVLVERWNSIDVGCTIGTGPDGRMLPRFAYKALERLGWSPMAPIDVHVCSRMRRMAGELAGRNLRAGAVRAAVVTAILPGYPLQTPEQRDCTRGLLPDRTSWTWVRNVCRRVHRYARQHQGALPSSLFDMEPTSKISAVLSLAVADTQFCMFTRTSAGQFSLRVLLPTCTRPSSRKDWAWVSARVHLPKVLGGVPGPPTLRLKGGRVLADVPLDPQVPGLASQHRVAIGLDWGVSRLFTGSVLRLELHSGKPVVTTDGHFLQANLRGLQEHYHQLRQHHERVRRRLVHNQRLEEGQQKRGRPPDSSRQGRTRVLTQEAERLAAHMSALNREMSWLSARWAVEQAKAVGATLIVVENLDDLEPTRLDKRRRTQVSATVRGLVQENLEYLAGREGIRVIKVPARDTSARCPRCVGKLSHVLSPDQPTKTGYPWARCRTCGFGADRDHSASERIGQRGLLLAWGEEHTRSADPRRGVAQPADLPVRRRVHQRRQSQKLPQLCGRKHLPHLRRTPRGTQVVTQTTGSAAANSDPPKPQQPRRACRPGTPPLLARPAGHRSAGPGTAVPCPSGTLCQSRTNTASPTWRVRGVHPGPLDGTRYALRSRARFTPIRLRTSRIGFAHTAPSPSPSINVLNQSKRE